MTNNYWKRISVSISKNKYHYNFFVGIAGFKDNTQKMFVFVNIPNYTTKEIKVDSTHPIRDIECYIQSTLGISSDSLHDQMYLTGRHGSNLSTALTLPTPWICVQLRICGGKGGFGSTLRAQGSRMSSNQPANYDQCRDLQGRRLKRLKDAENMAKAKEEQEKLQQEIEEKRKEKIKKGLNPPLPKKHRFDDTKYTRNCERIVERTGENTRKAVVGKVKKPEQTNAGLVQFFGEPEADLSDSESSSSEGEGK